MTWLDQTPLLAIEGGFVLLLLLSVEAGYRGYRWVRPKDGRKMTGQEFLLSAVLGLLALLLGFTFSLSLSRYEARRALVVQEANAIDTAWLRTQLLDEPYRGEASGLLKQYADARLAWSEGGVGHDLGPTQALQGKLAAAMQHATHGGAPPVVVGWVLTPLDDAFGLQAARLAARSTRVPDRVLAVLVLYSALSMVMLGYILAINGHRHEVATGLLLVLLTLAFGIILDLDRPQGGAILVSQQPLIDMRASMR
ncbi:MAG TPA: hypothetical protein VGM25_09410 [Caulobacteraceae bacterium]|jgi:hypothetical protein